MEQKWFSWNGIAFLCILQTISEEQEGFCQETHRLYSSERVRLLFTYVGFFTFDDLVLA